MKRIGGLCVSQDMLRKLRVGGIVALFLLVLAPSGIAAAAASVTIDNASYNVGTGFGSSTPNTGTDYTSVDGSFKQSDGKIVAWGAFTSYNGTAANHLVRINTNGSIDTSFSAGTGYTWSSGTQYEMAQQSSGKLIFASTSTFGTYNGTSMAKGLMRLNTDGSLDTAFNATIGVANAGFSGLSVTSADKIFLAGSFNSFKGVMTGKAVLLNSNGSISNTFGFTSSIGGGVEQQPSDNVIFTDNAGGIYRYDLTSGAVGTTCNSGTGVSPATQLQMVGVQPDGKIFVQGAFTSYDGHTLPSPGGTFHLMRLNADCSFDTSFTPPSGTNYVNHAVVQPDGKIIFYGQAAMSWGTTTTNGLVRVNDDGSRDMTFDVGSGINSVTDPNSYINGSQMSFVNSIIVFDNQHYAAFGPFNRFNGTPVNGTASLTGPGGISGTVYSDEGLTNIGAGRKVSVLIDGSYNSGCSATTDSAGAYMVNCTAITNLTSGHILTVYLDDDTENGITYTIASGPAMNGIDIYLNSVIARSDGGTALTTVDLLAGTPEFDQGSQTNDLSVLVDKYGQSTTSLLFTADELYIPAGQTLDIRGASLDIDGVASSYLNGKMSINGTLNSDNDLRVDGDWYLNPATGAFLNSGASASVVMASTADHSFTNAATFPANLRIWTDSGIKVLLGTNLSLGSHDLTVSTGYLDLNGHNFSMAGGALTNDQSTLGQGGIRLQGGETVTFSAGSGPDSAGGGIWEYYGDGSGAAKTIKDFGADDYPQLYINDVHSSGRDTFQAASNLHVINALTVKSGTLDMGSRSLTTDQVLRINGANGVFLGGSGTDTITSLQQTNGTLTLTSGNTNILTQMSQTGGFLSHNNGLVDFPSAAYDGSLTVLDPLYNLQNDAAYRLKLYGPAHVAHNLVNNSVFDSNTSALAVDGDLTSNAGFYAPRGTSLTIGGDLINNAGFNYGTSSSSTIFNGTVSKIRGSSSSITFCGLTKPTAVGATFGIGQGVTVNVDCALTMNGTTSNPILVRTVTVTGTILNNGATAALHFNSGASGSVSHLDVRDNSVSSASSSVVIPVNPANSLNSGNSVGWFGLTIAPLAAGSEPATPVTFTVTAGGVNNTGSPITTNYSFVGGTATAGSDYSAATTSVSIPNGSSTATISVPVLDDTAVEPTETVQLQLSGIVPAAAYTASSVAATGQINDNDDSDGDGVSDSVEDMAPNGDGNGDGVADRLQSDVTTNTNSLTGGYETATVNAGCSIKGFVVVPATIVGSADSGYTYPVGMNSYTLHCTTPGQAATVQFYYDKDYQLAGSTYRNYSQRLGSYATIAGTALDTAAIYGTTVSRTTYQVTDGGALDDDGMVDGVIIDPSGPARLAMSSTPNLPATTGGSLAGTLANTGQTPLAALMTSSLLLTAAFLVKFVGRPKQPKS